MQVGSRSPIRGLESFFLKVAIASGSCLGCRGRALICEKLSFLSTPPKAHLGQINRKARTKNPLEIDATPARNPILLRIGAGLHEAPQFFHLLF